MNGIANKFPALKMVSLCDALQNQDLRIPSGDLKYEFDPHRFARSSAIIMIESLAGDSMLER